MLNKNSKKSAALLAGIIFCFCLLVAFEIWKFYDVGASEEKNRIYSLITSFTGSALFVLVIIYSSYSRILKINIKDFGRHMAFILPCLLVAVNNFPIIPFLSGKAYIAGNGADVFLYFLVCLGTGMFEELVFRGYIFLLILEKRKSSVKELFAAAVMSSAIFGLTHIFNIFAGANPFSTILQVGYSFLVGGMCSVILLKTGSVWYPAFIHAIYNFAGGVIPNLGGGTLWDAPTVIITAVLSVLAAVYLIVSLMRADVEAINNRIFEGQA